MRLWIRKKSPAYPAILIEDLLELKEWLPEGYSVAWDLKNTFVILYPNGSAWDSLDRGDILYMKDGEMLDLRKRHHHHYLFSKLEPVPPKKEN